MPYAYSRAAAWLVGVNWNMFYPLLRALQAVGLTYAAYGVAWDNITTGASGDKQAEYDIFLPHLLHTARTIIPNDTA